MKTAFKIRLIESLKNDASRARSRADALMRQAINSNDFGDEKLVYEFREQMSLELQFAQQFEAEIEEVRAMKTV